MWERDTIQEHKVEVILYTDRTPSFNCTVIKMSGRVLQPSDFSYSPSVLSVLSTPSVLSRDSKWAEEVFSYVGVNLSAFFFGIKSASSLQGIYTSDSPFLYF